jgi:hypothetical protein
MTDTDWGSLLRTSGSRKTTHDLRSATVTMVIIPAVGRADRGDAVPGAWEDQMILPVPPVPRIEAHLDGSKAEDNLGDLLPMHR